MVSNRSPFRPDQDGPAARGPDRPRGSKNKPKLERATDSAAELLAQTPEGEHYEERFVSEVQPRGEQPPRELALEATASDPDFERLLIELADFKRFGKSARSPMTLVQDVSPSEIEHEQVWKEGAPELAKELEKSVIARNLLDVVHITGAESAEVVGFSHGAFNFPSSIRYGQGTSCKPWMKKVGEVMTTYEEFLKLEGIATREGLVVFASDFHFDDFDEAALSEFRAFCRQKRLVIVSAMLGHADRTVAAKFSDPIPPVDLKRVPLALFIRELTKTATQSLSRHGSLEGLMAGAVAALNERKNS